jgi:GNAT superfamily N-acetyltransferase
MTASEHRPRNAEDADIEAIARIWHAGWRDAHADILPEDLARYRTLDGFRERAKNLLADTRALGPPGALVAFYTLKGDELFQFYVDAAARGTGVASVLIADAEALLAARGVATAWLDCAIGNARAARFYEKSGWQRNGTVVSTLATPDSVFEIDVWRYEKELLRGGR